MVLASVRTVQALSVPIFNGYSYSSSKIRTPQAKNCRFTRISPNNTVARSDFSRLRLAFSRTQRGPPYLLKRSLGYGVSEIRVERSELRPAAGRGCQHWLTSGAESARTRIVITAQSIRSDGSSYLDKHLRKNDYWEEGEKDVGGVWFGDAAQRLGLVPGEAVTAEQFGALADNRHPTEHTKLTARDKGNRKSFTDIQLSAPKDVSVLALLGDDSRVQAAFRASVGVGMEALQRFAAVRERRGDLAGSDESRQTGNMVAAVYFHDSSRQIDPQLHAHAVTANLSWDEATGRFLALQSRDMLRASGFARRAMYDDLARRLGELGYEIYGMNKDGFQVRGVEHLRERFSKRQQDIEQAAKVFEQREGRKPTDDERAILTRETRGDKLKEIGTEEVRAFQRSQLSATETHDLAGLVARASASVAGEDRPSPAALVSDPETLDQYLSVGFQEANERASVAWEWDALDAALAHAQAGGVSLDPAALVERLRARGTGEGADLHAAPGFRVTTSAVLDEERGMANLALSGRDAFLAPVADVDRLEAAQARARAEGGLVLSDEQMHAARLLAASKDGCSVLVGDAGTGKTSSLAALRDASAKKWVTLGPTTRARDELQKGGFKDADTLQSFLLSAKKQKAARGSVVLVDEAGTMGTPETKKLLEIARREKFQVVFVGDPKQHASVVRGDALRASRTLKPLPSLPPRMLRHISAMRMPPASPGSPPATCLRICKKPSMRTSPARSKGRKKARASPKAKRRASSLGGQRMARVTVPVPARASRATTSISATVCPCGAVSSAPGSRKHSAFLSESSPASINICSRSSGLPWS